MKTRNPPRISVASTFMNLPLALFGGVLICAATGAENIPFAEAEGVTLVSGPPGFGNNQTATLTYEFSALTTIGNIQVLTQGVPNLDFKRTFPDSSAVSAPTCVSKTYFSGDTCSVIVTFTPLAPGARIGAVQLLDGNEQLLTATTLLGGGAASAIAYTPASQFLLGRGFASPAGLALDGIGDVFIADRSGKVYEVLAAGGYTTVKTLGGSFAFGAPSGVALDGSGNLFVSDSGTASVYELLANGDYTTVNTLVPSFTFGSPSGIAFDQHEVLLVADAGGNGVEPAIYQLPPLEGGYTTVINLTANTEAATIFRTQPPAGIAVDSLENIFVAAPSGAAVYEILAREYTTTINALDDDSSFKWRYPTGVAVNASNRVFVTDGGYSTPLEIVPPVGSSTVLPVGIGFTAPYGIALDGNGNVYVSDSGKNNLQLIKRSVPPSVNFANTYVGGTSTDSPQSSRIENIGNTALTGSGVLTDDLDFTVVQGSGAVPTATGPCPSIQARRATLVSALRPNRSAR